MLTTQVRHISGLGQWFTARTSLMSSVVSQKLGLFHNQHFFRAETKATGNPYIGSEAYIESLVRCHVPPAQGGKDAKTPPGYRDVFKNSSPIVSLERREEGEEVDHLGRHGAQMVAVATSVQREFHRKLFILWQSRGENCNSIYDEHLISYFKTRSRLLHYIYTPMLFLPKWRWQANATRDHAAAEFPFEEAKVGR